MAHEIFIPRLGWSMEQGIFVGWLKQDGNFISEGEPLFELEGEKGLQEVEAIDSGVLRIPPNSPQPDSTVEVGTLLGFLVEEGERLPWETSGSADSSPDNDNGEAKSTLTRDAGQPADEGSRKPRHAEASIFTPENGNRALPSSSPRARRVARELGVDWKHAQGTGVGGRIREADVRTIAFACDSVFATERVTPGESLGGSAVVEAIPITPRRRTIAERMLASRQQTAPVTLTTRVDTTQLVKLRGEFQAAGGIVPTYTDIASKLTALVLRRHPQMAARWRDDHLEFPAGETIDINIAVDLEEGLVAPLLRDVARRSLPEIAAQSQSLVAAARLGKIAAVDLEGGDFTVTNLGGLGIDAFTPIIHRPQTAILGLGAIRREPVVAEDDKIEIRELQTLSLTFDHRAIDGAPAARFLLILSTAFANPWAWLIGLETPPPEHLALNKFILSDAPPR